MTIGNDLLDSGGFDRSRSIGAASVLLGLLERLLDRPISWQFGQWVYALLFTACSVGALAEFVDQTAAFWAMLLAMAYSACGLVYCSNLEQREGPLSSPAQPTPVDVRADPARRRAVARQRHEEEHRRRAVARQRHEEEHRRRAVAELRAAEFLRSCLTPEQNASYETHGHFEVLGSRTGTRYRIHKGYSQNVHQLSPNGWAITGLCFMPERCGDLPEADIVAIQKLALECNEDAALNVAIGFPARALDDDDGWD